MLTINMHQERELWCQSWLLSIIMSMCAFNYSNCIVMINICCRDQFMLHHLTMVLVILLKMIFLWTFSKCNAPPTNLVHRSWFCIDLVFFGHVLSVDSNDCQQILIVINIIEMGSLMWLHSNNLPLISLTKRGKGKSWCRKYKKGVFSSFVNNG